MTFGNAASENGHSLVLSFPEPVTPAALVTAAGGTSPTDPSQTTPSQLVTSGMNTIGRALMPRGPNPDVYGGQATFTMVVDPVQQNYFTMKIWGADPSGSEFLILDCNGLEIGARHGGNDMGEMLWDFGTGWNPNGWVYRTLPLPLNLTQGQTKVTLRIRSVGYLAVYDDQAPYFGNYQKLMSSQAPIMYNVYTHTGAYFDASSETQGSAVAAYTPLTTPTAAATISSLESAVNSTIANDLAASPSSLAPVDVDYMAQTYGTSWSTYAGNSAVVSQVIAGIDAMVTAYAANPTSYMGTQWGGAFGEVGDTIRLLWPEINVGNTMSTAVAYGGSLGTVSRTTGWSTALRASVDSGRFGRQTITNQSIAGGTRIYNANRGLELVQSSNALYKSEALRYIHEAAGLSPWLGNDQAGEGQTPVYGTAPYGPNWYMMTTKGTSKEDGFVGSDYGEVGSGLYHLGLIANDSALQSRALLELQARDYFRYTTADPNNYLIMEGAEPVGVRNDGLPGHTVYLGRITSDDFVTAAQGISAIGSNLMGYFQQGFNQGQAWPVVASSGYGSGGGVPLIPDAWATASAQSQANVLLPETTGANLPNFAWADEQNMVVAAKYGSGTTEESFYINMNWREPGEIQGIAKKNLGGCPR